MYLEKAGEKLGVRLEDAGKPVPEGLAFQIEVLYVLRCLMGPVVESLIILDRFLYLVEECGDAASVKAINLFDQNTGSGRNVALVVQEQDR